MKLNNITQSDYILLAEAAKSTPYSSDYLRLRARQGKLRAKKINGLWYTKPAWLQKYNQLNLVNKSKTARAVKRNTVLFFIFETKARCERFNVSHFLSHKLDLLIYYGSLGLGRLCHRFNLLFSKNDYQFICYPDKFVYKFKIIGVIILLILSVGVVLSGNSLKNKEAYFAAQHSNSISKSVNKDILIKNNFFKKSFAFQLRFGGYIANSFHPGSGSIMNKFTTSYSKMISGCNLSLGENKIDHDLTFQYMEGRFNDLIANILNIHTSRNYAVSKQTVVNNKVKPAVLGESDFRGKFPTVRNVPPPTNVITIKRFTPKLLDSMDL